MPAEPGLLEEPPRAVSTGWRASGVGRAIPGGVDGIRHASHCILVRRTGNAPGNTAAMFLDQARELFSAATMRARDHKC